MKKFIYQHMTLLTLSVFGILIGLLVINILFQNLAELCTIIMLCVLLLFIGMASYVNRPMIKATKAFNDECDPYPLLKVTEEYLTFAKPNLNITNLVLNRSATLSGIDRDEEALQILLDYNIEIKKNISLTEKLYYYNNLSALYLSLGDLDNGIKYMELTKQIISSMKKVKLNNIPCLEAECCLLTKNYQGALNCLNSQLISCKRQSVSMAFLAAKALIGLNNIEEAKKQLNYVIANGNKLAVVKMAEKLLSEIQS
ncbi:MAG: hypothetical protein ACI4HO_06080 [Ruminococcus sp.]